MQLACVRVGVIAACCTCAQIVATSRCVSHINLLSYPLRIAWLRHLCNMRKMTNVDVWALAEEFNQVHMLGNSYYFNFFNLFFF